MTVKETAQLFAHGAWAGARYFARADGVSREQLEAPAAVESERDAFLASLTDADLDFIRFVWETK
jgi:hypothetical protein